MALYRFFCKTCDDFTVKLLADARPEPPPCKVCNGLTEHRSSDIKTHVKEIIDNGLQAKRVEQFDGGYGLIIEREDNQRRQKERELEDD